MSIMRKASGFTIIELMVVVALIAVIASFAVPQFGRIIENNRIVAATNSVTGIISFARSEAVRRGERVTVTSADNTLMATLAADGTEIRRIEPSAGGLSITDANVSFRGSGVTVETVNVEFDICAGSAMGRRVTVFFGGRTSVTENPCS